MGKRNEFLQEFIGKIPEAVWEIAHDNSTYYHLTELVKEELRQYYHYTGSLTTPPYTETVHWAVSRHVLEAPPVQIAKMNKIEGNNARHI